ncbi:hypothetical protein A8L34_29595 [Bacillus sp. FJAT-27264]|uniref:hypothetical protein n=1 Tax=Paenibacillus sp. (strain DSM 101736 / FJAT-27264) TaxID=1850362 RepID=UPI000807C2EE|nr:hypothetical protein [Bacillus sp. FJAT-27264]OBZ15171.1 hypothetical protein A8L34_29595 [Bacillus sp. FJAT-27264]
MNVESSVEPGTMSNAPSPVVYDVKAEVVSALSDFYHSHVEGSLQIFHSLTLGEIMIAVLLAAILLVMCIKWIWEVVRYG